MPNSPDILTRLRALNPVPYDDAAPSFALVRMAIGAASKPGRLTAPGSRRVRRGATLCSVGVAAAVTVSVVVASGPSRQAMQTSSPLGVLQTAQAVAAANPLAARFSGFTAE